MRTFIAFTLPDDAVQQLIEWQQTNLPPNVHPEPSSNLHLTLAFLGETEESMVPEINQILSQLNVSEVHLSGPVAYEEQDKLAFLVYQEQGGTAVWEQLNAELEKLNGYTPQFKPWLPHTTIWRYGPDNKPNINPPLPNLSFTPTAVTLYQSVKNPEGGANYVKVSTEEKPRIVETSSFNPNKDDFIWVWDSGANITYVGDYGTYHIDMIAPYDIQTFGSKGWGTFSTGEIVDSFFDASPLVMQTLQEFVSSHGQSRQANIFDPISKQLDQRVFNGIKPRPGIVQFIEETFYETMEQSFIDNPEDYFDLALTGSLTTFQFSESSDCDISVFVHYDAIMETLEVDSPGEIRKELIHIVTTQADGTILPGTEHPLQFFIIPEGNTIKNYFATGMRSGYSFNEGGWIVAPEKKRVHDIALEMPELYSRCAQMADKMTTLLDAHDITAARDLFAQIHKKRNSDEMAGLGDFSDGNLVYKYLLHEGLFDRLREEAGVHIASVEKFPIKESNGFSLKQDYSQDYKYHFDGQNLTVWKVHQVTGDPHHFEKVGPDHAKAAEGRIYNHGPGDIYQMVWINRGDPTQRAKAVASVNEWSIANLGGPITYVGTEVDESPDLRTASDKRKILYDFEKDRIFFDRDPTEHRASIIVGEYDGKDVWLHGTAKEWINANYFKRLWLASFPSRPIHKIHIDGKSVATRPTDQMTYTQKLPFLVSSGVQVQNPINYEFVPLTSGELSHYSTLSNTLKSYWMKKAQNLNDRALQTGSPGTVTGRELAAVYYRFGGTSNSDATCAYDGQPGANSWDHVIPLSQGGANVISNLLPVHDKCNQEMDKWDRTLMSPGSERHLSPKWLEHPAVVASDPWRKGTEWKAYIKNEGVIVDFQIGDPKDDPVEGRIKEINKDSLKIEVEPGEYRTLNETLLKQIKFKLRDDKHSLSHWKEASGNAGDCTWPDCDYDFSKEDIDLIDLAHGWFTCPQCDRTYNVRTKLDKKTSAVDIKELQTLAEKHKPEGGYGETCYNPETETVLWIPADWTSIEEEEAAREDFLKVDGVKKVEGEAEQGLPWERDEDGSPKKPMRMQKPWVLVG